MSLKIQRSGLSRIQQSLKPRSMIGATHMRMAKRVPFKLNPTLRDRGYITPEARKVYPYETHIKRYPVFENINISYFTKYAEKPLETRNMFETMHALPFRGAGFRFWRETKGPASWVRPKDFMNYKGAYGARNQYFVPETVSFRDRPWNARVFGSLYLNGHKLKSGIRPLAFDQGSWHFARPDFAARLPQSYREPLPESRIFEKVVAPALEPGKGKITKRSKA